MSRSIAHPQLTQVTSTKMHQGMIMTDHMQQALQLLQIPVGELESFIQEQIQENPLLEWWEEEGEAIEPDTEESPEEEISISDQDLSILQRLDTDWTDHFCQTEPPHCSQNSDDEEKKAFLESLIEAPANWRESLLAGLQIGLSDTEKPAAEILIGSLNSQGFLDSSIQELARLHGFEEKTLHHVLALLQKIGPPGIGASNRQQALLLQLEQSSLKNSLAYRLIQLYYPELLKGQFATIRKKLKISDQTLQAVIQNQIRPLSLTPITEESHPTPPVFLHPDVYLSTENGEISVRAERDLLPPLRIRRHYLRLLQDPSLSAETKSFIRQKFFSARWLARNLQQRYCTVERVADALAKRQKAFLSEPKGEVVPVTIKNVAEELQLHESTVARAIAGKYMATPRGLLPLKDLLSSQYTAASGETVSGASVRDAIQQLILREDKKAPLSDEAIVVLLEKQGIRCARRTAAKWRAYLEIPNARQRKTLHTL